MTRNVRQLVALAICVSLVTSGCATTHLNVAPAFANAPGAQDQKVDPAVMAEYVKRLPPGTTVRVDRIGGKSMRATLIKTTDRSLVVQAKTRIPEPAIEIPYDQLLRVVPETSNGGNLGKAIGIGIAAGAGAILTVFVILAAIYSD